MVFFATIGLLAITVGIQTLAMYACRQFVGQKPPATWIKAVVILGIGGGLLFAVLGAGFYARKDGMTASEWIVLAWIAGSALTGQIALLELIGRTDDSNNNQET